MAEINSDSVISELVETQEPSLNEQDDLFERNEGISCSTGCYLSAYRNVCTDLALRILSYWRVMKLLRILKCFFNTMTGPLFFLLTLTENVGICELLSFIPESIQGTVKSI